MTGVVHLDARDVPLPRSVSPEARSLLAAAAARTPMTFPDGTDPALWKQFIVAADAGVLTALAPLDQMPGLSRSTTEIAGVPCFVATPDGAPDDRVYLDIHGGGLVMLGGDGARLMGLMTAARVGVATVSPDYRMPPDHPYPAALDDVLAVYCTLLERYPPARIVIGGASAGGNLAAALALRARDEGLPPPAGLVLLTPELDLTESGDSFETNRDIDVILKGSLMNANRLYAAGADLAHPYLSPLFGDFANGFPRTLLQTGTRDLFLSNTVRMHRALLATNVPVELHVFEAMPHGGFGGAPEDAELDATVRRFVDSCWGR